MLDALFAAEFIRLCRQICCKQHNNDINNVLIIHIEGDRDNNFLLVAKIIYIPSWIMVLTCCIKSIEKITDMFEYIRTNT